jgi:hypothetical protein
MVCVLGYAKIGSGGATIPPLWEPANMIEPFPEFPKIARWSREVVITEKIDGTNALIAVGEDGSVRAGSRTCWITPEKDNFGFAAWVKEREDELRVLGPGNHYGEWWGSGIQRKYGLSEKRFSLFDTGRWGHREGLEVPPPCCHVVPILFSGIDPNIENILMGLREFGSMAAPGFMNPEGICIYHTAAKVYFKKTLVRDEEWKGKAA